MPAKPGRSLCNHAEKLNAISYYTCPAGRSATRGTRAAGGEALQPMLLLRRLHERREIRRLRALPRYQATSTWLLGPTLQFVDARSFLVSCYEIFGRQVYRFPSSRESPRILDCGANIGLATLYWKQLYPEARITAFEPDPIIFRALARNCAEWQTTRVELVDQAMWSEDGEMQFWPEGGHSGRLLPDGSLGGRASISVRTGRLRDYLRGPIDLLKLDIEGAETEVLLDCADGLGGVEHLFVEYHSFIDREQRLDTLLAVLRSAGYRIHVQPKLAAWNPFVTRPEFQGMDQTVNIYAFRRAMAEQDKPAPAARIDSASAIRSIAIPPVPPGPAERVAPLA
jgi:FkbM family methyltransferase